MFSEEYVTVSQIADAYFSMYPELYHDSNVYFILDEIEMLHSWGSGISGLLDSHPANVLITGSQWKDAFSRYRDRIEGTLFGISIPSALI